MVLFEPEYNEKVPQHLLRLLPKQDSAVKVRHALMRKYKPKDVAGETVERRAWELCGSFYLQTGRAWEAIEVFIALYEQMMLHQERAGKRIHKGVPLFWLYDCHRNLGNSVLAKRYLMLTVAEDAVTDKGKINRANTGTYHRCVWNGMPEGKFVEYSLQFWKLAKGHRQESRFPEWLLQEVDQEWMTDHPASLEATLCPVGKHFAGFLLDGLGRTRGKSLERLAHYLLSCVPGFRVRMRLRSRSTDYDVLGVIEGTFTDFRSEIGRYFLCECKDWSSRANFSALAKFCRVLDSTKTKFGILFSKMGITGTDRTTDAERELLKVFQDRGVVIVVVTEADLKQVVQGTNFVTILRDRYERVRFDLSLGTAAETR